MIDPREYCGKKSHYLQSPAFEDPLFPHTQKHFPPIPFRQLVLLQPLIHFPAPNPSLLLRQRRQINLKPLVY